MTKSGEKPAKPAPVSKKKNAEVGPQTVEWTVEDFVKDLQYFHEVIGLPNVGKIPKDITVEDVPLAELEKHFGSKAKTDKNGYKKEGIKGIPAEDIQKLVLALDGIEKFQLYSLEIARGLYYERIYKKAVNWAACGVDKHRGQLSWRLNQKSLAQLQSPPWKRVEHKYTSPLGLHVIDYPKEGDNYEPSPSKKLCEMPNEEKKANGVGAQCKLTDKKAALPGDVKKSDDVGAQNLTDKKASLRSEEKKANGAGAQSKLTDEKAALPGDVRKVDNVGAQNLTVEKASLHSEEMTIDNVGPVSNLAINQVALSGKAREADNAGLASDPITSSSKTREADDVNLASDSSSGKAREADDVGVACGKVALSGEAKKANDVNLTIVQASLFGETRNVDVVRGESITRSNEKGDSAEIESQVPNVKDFTDTKEDQDPFVAIVGEVSDFHDVTASETTPMESWLGNNPIPKLSQTPILNVRLENNLSPKPKSFVKLTGTPISETKDELFKSWLEIVKHSLEELGAQVEKLANIDDLSKLTALLSANRKLAKDLEIELCDLADVQAKSVSEAAQLSLLLEDKVAEKNRLSSWICFSAKDQPINDADQAQFLVCCSDMRELQEAIDSERQKHDAALKLANSKLPQYSMLDDSKYALRGGMRVLKETATRLTKSHDALKSESSRLKQLICQDLVYVSPVSIVCPLQVEDSYFPITECPVCSLGFVCNNWVPTPCGHCYHRSCLFPLLRFDDNRVPKCEACSKVFHPSWLECWGSPLVNHPEVVKLADEWGLKEQAKSFTEALSALYSKNASRIKPRRKTQAAKHKNVTKLYSKDSVKKSTQYHETVGRAEIIDHGFIKAEAKGIQRVDPVEAQGPGPEILEVGRKGKENSPRVQFTDNDLQVVQDLIAQVGCIVLHVEKGAQELKQVVQNLDTDSEKPHADTLKKVITRKRKEIDNLPTTALSPAKLKLRDTTLSQGSASLSKPQGRHSGRGRK